MSREESKWLMSSLDLLKRLVRNGNLGNDSRPAKFGWVGVDAQLLGCFEVRKRNLACENSIAGAERDFSFRASIVGLQSNPFCRQTSSFPNRFVMAFDERSERRDN